MGRLRVVRVVRFPMRELVLVLFVEVEEEFTLVGLTVLEGGESGCVVLSGVRLNDVKGEDGEK